MPSYVVCEDFRFLIMHDEACASCGLGPSNSKAMQCLDTHRKNHLFGSAQRLSRFTEGSKFAANQGEQGAAYDAENHQILPTTPLNAHVACALVACAHVALVRIVGRMD